MPGPANRERKRPEDSRFLRSLTLPVRQMRLPRHLDFARHSSDDLTRRSDRTHVTFRDRRGDFLMPQHQYSCPECGLTLQSAQDISGTQVECLGCQATYVAASMKPASWSSPAQVVARPAAAVGVACAAGESTPAAGCPFRTATCPGRRSPGTAAGSAATSAAGRACRAGESAAAPTQGSSAGSTSEAKPAS